MSDKKISITIIEIFNKLIPISKSFDTNIQHILDMDKPDLSLMHNITKDYMDMRALHGKSLILLDNYIDEHRTSDDEKVQYEISTFKSILTSIEVLIAHTDFNYKKLAIKYPQSINSRKKMLYLIVKDKNSKETGTYIQTINELLKDNFEYTFSVIESQDNKQVVIKNICDKPITLELEKIEIILLVNGDIISELDVSDIHKLKSFL